MRSITAPHPRNSAHAALVKIAYLATSAHLGGAERVLLDIVRGIRTARPRWSVGVFIPGDGPLVKQVQQLDAEPIVLPFPEGLSSVGEYWTRSPEHTALTFLSEIRGMAMGAVAYSRQLRKRLHAFRPDVVHSNGLKMHVLSAWAKPPASTLVWHLHDYVASRPQSARLLRWWNAKCDAVITTSASVADDFCRVCDRPSIVRPVLNGVDLERFSPNGAVLDLDRLAGLPPTTPSMRVGLMGTFAKWKGHTTFLEAMTLVPRHLDICGYVIGGPVYATSGSQYTLAELRSVAARLGLTDRIGFTGFVEDSAAALRALDVVVHASTEPEPFGLVIAEAMACGRSIVTSLTGGVAEFVEPDVNALSHAPADAHALARAIVRLLESPGLRARLARAGRATAERRLDLKHFMRQVIDVYESTGVGRPAVSPVLSGSVM
jgi:glycosyltransferase involved in cell wall biosynthesis